MTVRFNVAEKPKADVERVTRRGGPRGVAAPGAPAAADAREGFENDEAAARHYVAQVFGQDPRPRVRALTAPERPEVVPDLRLSTVNDERLTSTRLLRFEQLQSAVPIFGSNVVVQIGPDRRLVSVDAQVADVAAVSPIAKITPDQALDAIAGLTGSSRAQLHPEAPTLTFFHDDAKNNWHLAWFFKKVPAAP